MSTIIRIIAVTTTVYLYTKVSAAHKAWLEKRGFAAKEKRTSGPVAGS